MTVTALPSAPAAAATPNGTTSQLTTLQKTCEQLNRKITGFLERPATTELSQRVQNQTRIALSVIHEALTKYTIPELSISFNGGKDCLVLLILLLSALPAHPPLPASIPSVYVMSAHPFIEVDEFVVTCIRAYGLDLERYALPMKVSFEHYLAEHPEKKAIFVGTRRTDPHGEFLTHFDRTDHGWPDFERVHPVIDWHYQEIWGFLRELEIPYCKLYDMGYTSLGGTEDTHPNPVLAEKDPSGVHFRPAYELVEDQQERLGRDR